MKLMARPETVRKALEAALEAQGKWNTNVITPDIVTGADIPATHQECVERLKRLDEANQWIRMGRYMVGEE